MMRTKDSRQVLSERNFKETRLNYWVRGGIHVEIRQVCGGEHWEVVDYRGFKKPTKATGIGSNELGSLVDKKISQQHPRRRSPQTLAELFAGFVVLLLLFLPTSLWCQQWSKDPVVDHMKQSMSDIIKAEAFMDYCRSHAQEERCAGVNRDENSRTTYVDWDSAVKMGSQKADSKSQEPEISLAEYAKRQRIQQEMGRVVTLLCKDKAEICKNQTPAQLVQKLIAEKGWTYWEKQFEVAVNLKREEK